MNCFYVSWVISALILLSIAAYAGKKVKFECSPTKSILGILIDVRERYSLNRLQIMMWTVLILSTFLGLLFSHLNTDPSVALAIPNELLGLMGISTGSAIVAGAVKDGKNTTIPLKIAGGKSFVNRHAGQSESIEPQELRFAQIILEEEGIHGENQVVSITKYQSLVFTLVLGVIYIVLTVKANGYPTLDDKILWLIGISQAGYVGGKAPKKD